MDTGEEVRIEVETEDLDRDEFVLYRVGSAEPGLGPALGDSRCAVPGRRRSKQGFERLDWRQDRCTE
jgi:hypothetical protein